jgi:tRNA(Ile)-lysidine synthetase-like protein
MGQVLGIFIHHHTRQGQDLDEKVVRDFCAEREIPFVSLHVEGLSPSAGNFEARAREKRHELCLKVLHKNELLWMGHHINDSFEWSFMQKLRSTNPRSSMGIPVRNKKITRPFLSVTREQIEHLRRLEDIPYRDDPTNRDLKHERNYIRQEITPLIKKRYHRYLKFYTHQANFMAHTLGLSVVNGWKEGKIYAFQDGAVLLGKNFSPFKIQELIHHYSLVERGDIVTSIEKMLRAIGKSKKGPFQFSGGIEAYYTTGLLMIYPKKMKNHDEQIAQVLTQLNSEDLLNLSSFSRVELHKSWENLLLRSDALMNMPGLILVLETDSLCKTLNASVFDPMFPKVSKVCKEKHFKIITFRKCLDIWELKKEKLPERLRLVPLFNLSHLFSSQ